MSLGSPTIQEGDVLVAVMGCTGSGKSTFVNVATGTQGAEVGKGLESCTETVSTVECFHPDGSGRKIIFVDTPGFNDTTKSDLQILELIAKWLIETYHGKFYLSKLLYLVSVEDNRMSGNRLNGLNLFEKLCGKDALSNVVIVSTMWDAVDPKLGAEREQELRSTYLKPLLASGAQLRRFSGDHKSAWGLMGQLSKASARPVLLQEEMGKYGKTLGQTSAGSFLLDFMKRLMAALRDLLIRVGVILKKSGRIEENELTSQIRSQYDDLGRQVSQLDPSITKVPPRLSRIVRLIIDEQRSRTRMATVQGNPSLTSVESISTTDSERVAEALVRGTEAPEEEETRKNRDEALTMTISTLEPISQIASLVPFPPLKVAIDLVLGIAIQLRETTRLDGSISALLDSTSSLLALVAHQMSSGNLLPNIRPFVRSLVDDLLKIRNIVSGLKKGTVIKRFLTQDTEKDVIDGCTKRVSEAYNQLNIILAIGANERLRNMESLLVDVIISFSTCGKVDSPVQHHS